jgi:hypothetical protein
MEEKIFFSEIWTCAFLVDSAHLWQNTWSDWRVEVAKSNVMSKVKKEGEKVNILDQGRIGFLHSFPIHRSQTISAWKITKKLIHTI